jgi:hypothetical protein
MNFMIASARIRESAMGLQQEPAFEVWTASGDPFSSDMGGPGQFGCDADTLADASTAMRDYQADGSAAWIVDKNTSERVAPSPAR